MDLTNTCKAFILSNFMYMDLKYEYSPNCTAYSVSASEECFCIHVV